MDNDQNDQNDKTTTTKAIPILIFLVIVLTGAMIGLAYLQMSESRQLSESVQSLRQEMAAARENLNDISSVTTVTGRLEENLRSLTERLEATAQAGETVDRKVNALQSTLAELQNRTGERQPAAAPGMDVGCTEAAPEPAEPKQVQKEPETEARMSEEEWLEQLDEMRARLASLKEDLSTKETKIVQETTVIQEDISGVKGRIGEAEKTLLSLRETVSEARLPELRHQVTAVQDEISVVEQKVQTLDRQTEAFEDDVEAFFKQVFYNDPRSRMESSRN